jgi:predicted DNA-binding ribbon-helix-helix protein
MPRTPFKTKLRPILEARTTVSLERQAYDALAEIAYSRRVSIGCVVREAVANYINDNNSKGSKSTGRGTK